VVNSPGRGLVDALNFGFSIARNEWIARFDVDDIYDGLRLHFQRELIAESVSAIFCDYRFEGAKGEYLGTIRSGIMNQMNIVSLVNNWRTPHPGALINKKRFFAVNGYQNDEYPVEDLGLWLRIKDVGALISTPHELLRYRLNPNSISANNRKIMHYKKSELLNKHDNLRSSITDLESNLWKMYRDYGKYSNKVDRRLLMLFDYSSVLRRNEINIIRNRMVILLCLRIFANPKALIAIFRLVFFKIKRARYRKIRFPR
jgi:hypothetical protein